MTTKTHYHIVVNMAGYLPDSDPIVCWTKRDAQDTAQEEAESWRDHIADWEGDTRKVYGNKRDGYVIDDPSNPYHVPTYISINPCCESDCANEEEW